MKCQFCTRSRTSFLCSSCLCSLIQEKRKAFADIKNGFIEHASLKNLIDSQVAHSSLTINIERCISSISLINSRISDISQSNQQGTTLFFAWFLAFQSNFLS
eukprot:Sdes_comp20049_c0_seq1m12910